jgi:NADH-quinone oxidoreductase subunit L
MWVPLAILAFFAAFAVFPTLNLSPLVNLLKAAEPLGAGVEASAVLVQLTWPSEHATHANESIKSIVTWLAFFTALAGFTLATLFYGVRRLNPDEVRNQFSAIYRLLWNKWWFDELYDLLFVRPCHVLARFVAAIDRVCIDGLIDGTARATRWVAHWWDRLADQLIVDGLVNLLANRTYAAGLWLRVFQTGKLRQYIMYIVVAAIAMFLLISFLMRSSVAS